MAYWVYILRSEKINRRYVGHTDDLDTRLARHNSGLVFATAPYRPWRLMHTERFSTRSEAMARERFYKSGKGRELLDQIEAALSWQSPPVAD